MASFFRSLSQRFRSSSNNPNAKTRANSSSAAVAKPIIMGSEGRLTNTNAKATPPAMFSATDCNHQPIGGQVQKKGHLSSISEVVDPKRECQCKVLLLDGTYLSVVVSRKASGQDIYDKMFAALDLDEKDYFGLQFTDHYHVHHWLDPLKRISKQVPIGPPYTFRFRVKFYSSEPNNLREELTRYQFFLQLKHDIQSGLLECPKEMAVELAALALQSEFGDYNPLEHHEAFVSEFRFHPQQDEQMEVAILEQYKSAAIRGLSPAQAELNYLNKAKWLELYGVDNHLVEGKDGNEYKLGLTPSGMLVFDGQQKIGLFFWEKIQRLDFRNRKLTLVVEEDADQSNTGQIQLHTFVFELSSHKACKHLWKCAIEHHTFFRLKFHRPPKHATRQLFRLGSTFKYRGRTEYENVHKEGASSSKPSVNGGTFERRPSQRYVPRQSHLQKQKFRQEVKQQVMATQSFGGSGSSVVSPTTTTSSSGYHSTATMNGHEGVAKKEEALCQPPPPPLPPHQNGQKSVISTTIPLSSSIPVYGGQSTASCASKPPATHITTIRIDNTSKKQLVNGASAEKFGFVAGNVSSNTTNNNANVLLPSAYAASSSTSTRIPKYIVSLDNQLESEEQPQPQPYPTNSSFTNNNISEGISMVNKGFSASSSSASENEEDESGVSRTLQADTGAQMNNNGVEVAPKPQTSIPRRIPPNNDINTNTPSTPKPISASKIPSFNTNNNNNSSSGKLLKSAMKKEKKASANSNLPILIQPKASSNAKS